MLGPIQLNQIQVTSFLIQLVNSLLTNSFFVSTVLYFDPTTNSQSYGQQISFVAPEMEQSNDNINISVEQVLHDESLSADRSSFEAQGPNFPVVSPLGYWTAEQPQVIPGGFCPQVAYQNSQMVNGEMGPMTLYFSPPYPYPVNH